MYQNVYQNNFIDNLVEMYIVYSHFITIDNNYWGNARLYPKLIIGLTYVPFIPFAILIPHILFDWHPAKEPYDIPMNGFS